MTDQDVITGTCHCGAVAFEVSRPAFTVACNCSICRRYAAQWVHSPPATARITKGEGATLAYVWGDGGIEFHICKTCGCTTHWMGVDGGRWAVNLNMVEPSQRDTIKVRHFDGAGTWAFLD